MERLRQQSKMLEKNIKPNSLLPEHLLVPSAGIHFYQYGLIFFCDPEIKRKFYYNPYFIFVVEVLYFSRSLISLLVPDTNRNYFVYVGDYMYFIRAKTHINIAATQYMMLGMSILLLNFINYTRDVKPTFLDQLAFLRGKATPASCGLHNRHFILGIIRKAEYAIRLTKFNTKLVFFVSFLLSFLPAMLNFTFLELLFFGFPWSILFAISSYYTFSSYFWNMTYFFIICHFIKYRIREINEANHRLLKIGPLKQWQLRQLQQQYVNISCQVNQFNDTYWSRYLCIAIGLLSTFNNTVFYTALFVDMNIVVKVSLFYATTLSSAAIFFVLNTASVVYHESSQAPKIFYSANKITSGALGLFKISSLIETISTRQIGFYVLNLFIINYSRFYEIFSLLIAYFLRIIELSRETNKAVGH